MNINKFDRHNLSIWIMIIFLLISSTTYALTSSRREIGADKVNKFGITGKGNTICLIDDCVDYTHPNLGGCTIEQFLAGSCAKVPGGFDFADNDVNTGNQSVFQSYRGSTYRGLQYNYESLPNLNIDWYDVDAQSDSKRYIEEFT